MKTTTRADRARALLLLRITLALMYVFAGADKLLQAGPLAYAKRLSAVSKTVTHLPAWCLWASGITIPLLQLFVGGLLLLGLFRRTALWVVAGILVIQTLASGLTGSEFGLDINRLVPFYIIVRLGLLSLLLLLPAADDRYSVDHVLGRSRPRPDDARNDRAVAIFSARAVLGTAFFFGGILKTFQLGPVQHAQTLFIEPYRDTILPVWGLWASGLSIPFFELVAGALVLVGLWTRPMIWLFAAELVFVTFGHFMNAPIYVLNLFILPRLALTLFVLFMPREDDVLSIGHLLERVPRSRARHGAGDVLTAEGQAM